MSAAPPQRVGVLALQGAVRAHLRTLRALGVDATELSCADELAELDAVVLPGGESTTIGQLLERRGLFEPLRDRLAAGMPALGTCAGMILLAAGVRDGRHDQRTFAVLDITVRRNAFGRQVDSFEAGLPVDGLDGAPFPAVFIRSPVVEEVGEGVEVLAAVDGRPVACRRGGVLATAFHPELAGDVRLHALWLEGAGAGDAARGPGRPCRRLGG